MGKSRQWLSALVAVGVAAGLLVDASASRTQASTGSGGSYVSVAPARIADTSDGIGFDTSGHVGPGEAKTVQVTSRGGLPRLADVSAVVIDVAGSSTADTRLYVDPTDRERKLASLSLASNAGWDSTTLVVEPGPDGKIRVFNDRGTTRVNIDVQGYFTKSSTEDSAGGYKPVTPTRVVDSVANKQLTTRLGGDSSKTVRLANTGDIEGDVTAVFGHLRALNSNGPGGLRVTAGNQGISQSTPSLLNYDAGRPFDTGAIIPVDSNGNAKLVASAGTSIDVAVDILGVFTQGSDGSSFHPLENARLYDSASTPEGNLQPGEARNIKVGGRLGMPDDLSLGSVAIGVTAAEWTKTSYVSVVNSDLPDDNGTSSVVGTGTYRTAVTSTSIVGVSAATREITIRNRSAGSVRVLLNTQGWFETGDMIDMVAFGDPDDPLEIGQELDHQDLAARDVSPSEIADGNSVDLTLPGGKIVSEESPTAGEEQEPTPPTEPEPTDEDQSDEPFEDATDTGGPEVLSDPAPPSDSETPESGTVEGSDGVAAARSTNYDWSLWRYNQQVIRTYYRSKSIPGKGYYYLRRGQYMTTKHPATGKPIRPFGWRKAYVKHNVTAKVIKRAIKAGHYIHDGNRFEAVVYKWRCRKYVLCRIIDTRTVRVPYESSAKYWRTGDHKPLGVITAYCVTRSKDDWCPNWVKQGAAKY